MTISQRIHIVGTAGSGKTTLGQELAARLGLPHIELDSLFWQENWRESDIEDYRTRVREALAGDAWVVDGNYSRVRDLVWERVEMVVWLDFSLWVCLRRVLVRSVQRILSREELWNGNRETFVDVFLTRESIVWYSFKGHRRLRQRYSDLFALPQNAHFLVAHLKTPAELEGFLSSLIS